MSWDAGGILFGQSGKGILRVSENGGQPTVIASVKNGEVAYGPQLLPGGEWVLFTIATAATSDGWDKAEIVVQSLKTAERKTLITGGSDGRYLPTGHIVYALSGVLFAVPFDRRALTVTGGAVPVVEGVKRSSTGTSATTHFSVSSTGSLVFVPGPASTSSGRFDLGMFGRDGTVQALKLPPAPYEYPRLSPNGKQIAVGTDDLAFPTDVVQTLRPNGTSRYRRPSSMYVAPAVDRIGNPRWGPHYVHCYRTANTQTAPPSGTSGNLPGASRLKRDCIARESTPQPDCTATYCLPSTVNDDG